RGEYVLSVKGNTPVAPPFRVTATTPADGAAVISAPNFTVDFNDAVLLSTVQATDLVIDGTLTATGFTAVDGDTVRFSLPALGSGPHTVTLAAGSVADVQNTPVGAFSSGFTLDNIPPRVTATS